MAREAVRWIGVDARLNFFEPSRCYYYLLACLPGCLLLLLHLLVRAPASLVDVLLLLFPRKTKFVVHNKTEKLHNIRVRFCTKKNRRKGRGKGRKVEGSKGQFLCLLPSLITFPPNGRQRPTLARSPTAAVRHVAVENAIQKEPGRQGSRHRRSLRA